jgi:hypothetical protein
MVKDKQNKRNKYTVINTSFMMHNASEADYRYG